MVDFGLKLEDNKVDEWSDKYIRYEQLKAILKKCSQAVQRYKELAVKKPREAFEITEAYRNGVPTRENSRTCSRNSSLTDLETLDKDIYTIKEKTAFESTAPSGLPTASVQPLTINSSEQQKLRPSASGSESDALLTGATQSGEKENSASSGPDVPLLTQQVNDYGSSVDKKLSETPPTPTSSFINAISKAATNVTDYFSQPYERSLRDSLAVIDKYAEEFEKILVQDIDRVNTFYRSKMDEMDARVSVLKETVAHDFAAPPPPTTRNSFTADEERSAHSDDYLTTPLVHNHNRHSLSIARAVARISQRFTPLQMLTKSMMIQHHHQQQQSVIGNLSLYHDDDDEEFSTDVGAKKRTVEEAKQHAREVESIQRALIDLYRCAKLLQNFAIINFTGAVKITKKHDKTIVERKGRFKLLIKSENICNGGKDVEMFSQSIEQLYANWFCDRNVSDAKVQLLPKRGDALEMDWSQLRLGYRMGMCSTLGLWVCWDCIWGMLSSGQSTIGGRTAFPVFRACGGLLLLQWFWGCSVWTWSRYRVNYIYLFDFNPSIVASPLAIFNEAVDNSLVFLTTMLLYYKAGAQDLPGSIKPGIFPFILVLYSVYQLIFPLRTRAPMWKSIWLVVTTPMTSPVFFHSYIGDIFTSMVKIFQDMAWTFFFIASGDWLIPEDSADIVSHSWSKTGWYKTMLIPLLTLLPLWFRFNQCLRRYADTGQRIPHVANAFKYALSMTVTLFGAFHPLYLQTRGSPDIFQVFWTLNFIFSSLYSFFWDVYMDWGLGRCEYKMLGPRLMYPSKPFYYTVICIDLVLRFAWVLTLVPPDSGASFALPAYLTAVSMMFELFRRTIWGFLRLENEHRSNTSGYRRVDFVPLHFTTGHKRDYKKEQERRGTSVLVEIAIVTILVLAAAVASVVAAQHETLKQTGEL